MWRSVGARAERDSVFEVHDRSEMLLIKSHYPERVPHMVLDPRAAPGMESTWTRALIQEWAGEPVSVMVSIPPGAEQSSLTSALQDHGFVRGIRPSVAMARCASPTFDSRDDDDIALAHSQSDLEQARNVLATVFALPTEVFAFYTPFPVVYTYILREHGIGVAAGCLCPFAGVAGLYSIGVVPSARGKGYARRLVLYLLTCAAKRGITTAVLSCERSLVPLYRRLGFSACCDLTTYWMEALWR
jgi:GNAT superfamily N-acetyltransferase